MAQYMADIEGSRGRVSRLGTKSSGIRGHIRGWGMGVKVQCEYDEKTDSDVCHIYQTGGSRGATPDKLIKTIREKRAKRK